MTEAPWFPSCLAQAVWLTRPGDAVTGGGARWAWIAVGLGVALAVGGVISWLAWQDRRRSAPEERAFRALARRLRIGRGGRQALRRLAEQCGAPAVALLVSEHAFSRAVERALDARPASVRSSGTEESGLRELGQRIFGEGRPSEAA